MKRILYLDIDGVLLGKEHRDDKKIVLTKFAEAFLKFSLDNFKCYWLTTHGHEADTAAIINLLQRYAGENVIRLVKQIQPTT
jgi:hypothetical protein